MGSIRYVLGAFRHLLLAISIIILSIVCPSVSVTKTMRYQIYMRTGDSRAPGVY